MIEKVCISNDEVARLLDIEMKVWDKSHPESPMCDRLGDVTREEILKDIWMRLDVEDYVVSIIEEYLETDGRINDLRSMSVGKVSGGGNQS